MKRMRVIEINIGGSEWRTRHPQTCTGTSDADGERTATSMVVKQYGAR